jgi:hypothetical protein
VCPSYENDKETSRAADEGDMLHGIMEKHHIKALQSKEFKALGDERQISMIEMVVGYITPIIKAAKTDVEYEVELNLRPLKLRDTEFGTADVLAGQRTKRHADVIDYKFGWLEVDDAEFNIQGWLYALGAFLKCAWADTVTVHFLQPRRDEISSHTFDRSRMTEMLLRAQTINERRHELAGKEFNPVVSNCTWCANKAGCKALHGFILQLDGKVPLRFPAEVKTFDPPRFKDPKTAGVLYEFADMIGRWGWDMKRRITDLVANEGFEIQDFSLKTRKGNTTIIDPYRAVEIARDQFGVKVETLDDFLAIAEPSLHGIETAIGALQPRGAKGSTKDKFRLELAKEGIIESGRPSSWLEKTS